MMKIMKETIEKCFIHGNNGFQDEFKWKSSIFYQVVSVNNTISKILVLVVKQTEMKNNGNKSR